MKKYGIDRNEIVISTKGGKKLVDVKWINDINPKSIKENVDTSIKEWASTV